jgi:general secretion pathway protein E
VIEELGLRKLVPEGPIKLYEHIGCDECSNIGFYGRIIILELMQMTDQMRKLIMNHENSTKLLETALADGMQTMFVDGLKKALEGQTTIEEVLRVTSDT